MSVDAAFRTLTNSREIYARHDGPLSDYSRDKSRVRNARARFRRTTGDRVTARRLDIEIAVALVFPLQKYSN